MCWHRSAPCQICSITSSPWRDPRRTKAQPISTRSAITVFEQNGNNLWIAPQCSHTHIESSGTTKIENSHPYSYSLNSTTNGTSSSVVLPTLPASFPLLASSFPVITTQLQLYFIVITHVMIGSHVSGTFSGTMLLTSSSFIPLTPAATGVDIISKSSTFCYLTCFNYWLSYPIHFPFL